MRSEREKLIRGAWREFELKADFSRGNFWVLLQPPLMVKALAEDTGKPPPEPIRLCFELHRRGRSLVVICEGFTVDEHETPWRIGR